MPESTDVLVERVRVGLRVWGESEDGFKDWPAANAALTELAGRLEAAERERDYWEGQARNRAFRNAQARVAELEEALREIADHHHRSGTSTRDSYESVLTIARAALAKGHEEPPPRK